MVLVLGTSESIRAITERIPRVRHAMLGVNVSTRPCPGHLHLHRAQEAPEQLPDDVLPTHNVKEPSCSCPGQWALQRRTCIRAMLEKDSGYLRIGEGQYCIGGEGYSYLSGSMLL